MADNKKNSKIRKPGAVRRPGMGRQSNPFVDRTRIVDLSDTGTGDAASRFADTAVQPESSPSTNAGTEEKLSRRQSAGQLSRQQSGRGELFDSDVDDDFDYDEFDSDESDDIEIDRISFGGAGASRSVQAASGSYTSGIDDEDVIRIRRTDESGQVGEIGQTVVHTPRINPVNVQKQETSVIAAEDEYDAEPVEETSEEDPGNESPAPAKEKWTLFKKKKKSVLKQQKVTQEEYKFHKKMKRRRRRMVLVLLLVLFIVAATMAAGYTVYTFVVDHFNNEVSEDSIIIDIETEQKFRVEKRESTKSISQRLYDAGLIENVQIYRALSKFYGYDGQYNAGTYTLSKGLTYEEIMYILSGTPETVKVTFPEGFTTEQMAIRLENNHVCTAEEFLDAVDNADISSYDFLHNVDFSGRDHRLDGYLFPDTYEFDVYAKPEDVVYKMLNRFNEIFRPAYYEQLQVTGLTLDQVVILASIVEKEAKNDSDRAPIAGVFYNRYTRGEEDLELFQSDATVRYAYRRATGKDLDHPLSEELELDDPYNTYVYPGFTPGPICSPGEASLIGAIYPSNHDYFYFVARVDGSGGNVFSRTYEEHLQAIKDIANYVPDDNPGDEDVDDDW